MDTMTTLTLILVEMENFFTKQIIRYLLLFANKIYIFLINNIIYIINSITKNSLCIIVEFRGLIFHQSRLQRSFTIQSRPRRYYFIQESILQEFLYTRVELRGLSLYLIQPQRPYYLLESISKILLYTRVDFRTFPLYQNLLQRRSFILQLSYEVFLHKRVERRGILLNYVRSQRFSSISDST